MQSVAVTTYVVSVYSIQNYVIKFLSVTSDWWHSTGTPDSFPNKTDCDDIAEILLKVALNTPTIFSDVALNDRLLFIQKQIGMNNNTTKLYSIIPYSN